ncbi:hypothetical protein JCM8097_008578 [Rhodosporidiobolus ruineniae]
MLPRPSDHSDYPKESAGGKIQTIPFHLSPEKGLQISSTAAHSAFGISHVLRLFLARFFSKFGLSPDALGGFFHTGVNRIAFRPLLLPVWKVDLALKGKALLDQAEMQLNISALNASLPGFRLSPLDRLCVSPPLESEPVPFSASEHLSPFSSHPPSSDFPSGPPEVTLIPFTRTPLTLLDQLSSFPRTVATSGLSLDPRRFDPVLFAAYPLYIPLYLGEFELDEVVGGEETKRRVTTATFATTDGTAFAVYPQFLDPPTWLPGSSAVDLSIAGRPANPDELPPPEALQTLKPRLEEALDALKERFVGGEAEAEGVDPAGITEVVKVDQEEGGFAGYVERQGRALAYSEWADVNREYIEAVFEADNAEAFLHQIENIPDTARTVLLRPTGLPKVSSRASLLEDVRKRYEQAKAAVEALRPEWLVEVTEEEKGRKELERKEGRTGARGMKARGRA